MVERVGGGLAIAKDLVQLGHQVILVGRNAGRGKAVKESLGEFATFFSADITIQEDLQRLDEFVSDHFGRLDVLIHSDGIYPKDAEENRRFNLKGHYDVTVRLKKYFAKGRVLMVTGNPVAVQHAPVLRSQKTGLLRAAWMLSRKTFLMLYLAEQLKKEKMTVNAFFPGDVKSRLMPYTSRLTNEQVPVGAYLALSENVADISGTFFDEDGRVVLLKKGKYHFAKAKQILEQTLNLHAL
nr:SDR family NAD(P)-dependent oxidoreductase [Fructobacillus parabroussonetiae]